LTRIEERMKQQDKRASLARAFEIAAIGFSLFLSGITMGLQSSVNKPPISIGGFLTAYGLVVTVIASAVYSFLKYRR
jgi:hypothetical protein